MRLQAKVLTVSDRVAAGQRLDESGPAVAARLQEAHFEVVEVRVVPDGIRAVEAALAEMVRGFHGLVVTTGGTGFGPRDVTPEATRRVIVREAPGLAEAMRAVAPRPHGMLSRGVCGTVGAAVVCNLPGSVKGAVESLDAVVDAVPHALELLGGGEPH